jgi:hypothetical protein
MLIAVFVGMWIPVAMQLWLTLRSRQRFLERLHFRLDDAHLRVPVSPW